MLNIILIITVVVWTFPLILTIGMYRQNDPDATWKSFFTDMKVTFTDLFKSAFRRRNK